MRGELDECYFGHLDEGLEELESSEEREGGREKRGEEAGKSERGEKRGGAKEKKT